MPTKEKNNDLWNKDLGQAGSQQGEGSTSDSADAFVRGLGKSNQETPGNLNKENQKGKQPDTNDPSSGKNRISNAFNKANNFRKNVSNARNAARNLPHAAKEALAEKAMNSGNAYAMAAA